jgi:hypothetical protein
MEGNQFENILYNIMKDYIKEKVKKVKKNWPFPCGMVFLMYNKSNDT